MQEKKSRNNEMNNVVFTAVKERKSAKQISKKITVQAELNCPLAPYLLSFLTHP